MPAKIYLMNVQKHLKIAEFLVNLLENKFKIFRFKFGLDPFIGIVPGFGDLIPYLLSFYFVFIAVIAKAPKDIILGMIFFSTLDLIIGTIPIFGDTIDFFYHGHLKSYKLLKQHLDNINKQNTVEITKE